MKTIPDSVIRQVWRQLGQAGPEEAEALAQRMQQEQPYLMVYLLAADEECMDEADRGMLISLGAWIWQAMSQGDKPLRMVQEADLERAEEANIRALEELEEASAADYQGAAQRLLAGYNQGPLLGAVMEALMAGHEDDPEGAPDSTGLGLLYLKTVIDCLDQ